MKLKIGILGLIFGLLSSCMLGVVAVATGLAVYDRRSMAMLERDARIFHVIHTEIVRDPAFNDSHIGITSFNQIVLLTGQTPQASLRVQAEKIAKKTPKILV